MLACIVKDYADCYDGMCIVSWSAEINGTIPLMQMTIFAQESCTLADNTTG